MTPKMVTTDEQAVSAISAIAQFSTSSCSTFSSSTCGDESSAALHPQYLREFITTNRLPTVAKIVKGQYNGIGVATLSNPSLHSTVLLMSAGRARRLLAQTIKVKEGRRMVDVGPKFIIPDTYQGYFELLSEDGRPTRCVQSVAELAVAHRKSDTGWLVRDSMRAIVARYDDAPNCAGDSTITADGARIVNSGECLFPQAEVQLANSKSKFLRCTDSSGKLLLLSMEHKGRFSMVAKEDNISGVHTAKNLLRKRLPICVRLVYGNSPSGFKNPNQFLPEMRLLSALEEEQIFAMPIHKDAATVVQLPSMASLKLQRVANELPVKEAPAFSQLLEKCSRMASDQCNRAFLLDTKGLDSKFVKNLVSPTAKSSTLSFFSSSRRHKDSFVENDKPGSPLGTEYDEIDLIYDYVRGFAPLPKSLIVSSDPDPTTQPKLPPIETIPAGGKATREVKTPSPARINHRPVTRQISAGAVEDHDNPSWGVVNGSGGGGSHSKMYVKKNHSAGSGSSRRMLTRQKSCSPAALAEPVSPSASTAIFNSNSSSPIFNIRYKSLNNLHQTIDADLDSFNYGGGLRTSLDSLGAAATTDSLGTGMMTSAPIVTNAKERQTVHPQPIVTIATKLPSSMEKQQVRRTKRRMGRPRSLTNLVWESRQQHPQHGHGGHLEYSLGGHPATAHTSPMPPSSIKQPSSKRATICDASRPSTGRAVNGRERSSMSAANMGGGDYDYYEYPLYHYKQMSTTPTTLTTSHPSQPVATNLVESPQKRIGTLYL